MKRQGKLALIAAALMLLGAGTPISAGSTGSTEADGFLYGTVVTEGGRRYTGILRWGDEEAFWDDLFNGAKSKLPYIDRLPEDRRKRREIKVFGLRISYDWDEDALGRQFIARFGDIQEIRPLSGEKVDVKMKGGTTYRLDDGSNDIGATIKIQDPDVGAVEIEWKKIERIEFAAAPASLRPESERLYGEVDTEDGVFRGYVQWDSQECLSTDKLDGDSEDGKLSLQMGRIRSIEKKGRNSSTVKLKDGRKLDLRGTNDVDSSIRGILVEDERFGRVKISWDSFRRVEFQSGQGSGRPYGDYKPGTPLRGTVTDHDGKTWKGRLIFDLDESESWEMLNGDLHGIEYDTPMEMVRTIEPRDEDTSTIILREGRELRLEDSQDVAEANAGVLVIPGGGKSDQYVSWDQVQRIDFE
ncbi:MAG: hypothetical protein L0191_09385 [Acidobacteria bacterium]|nr:hypothetical protein [Acidobacteriota bacterium]